MKRVSLKKRLELIDNKLIIKDGQKFHSKHKNFSLSYKTVTRNMKYCLDYLQTNPEKLNKDKTMFYNISEAVTPKAHKEVLKIQRNATKKILSIINRKECQGEVPIFILSAIDQFSASNLTVNTDDKLLH